MKTIDKSCLFYKKCEDKERYNMKEEQKRFYDFMLERVKVESKEEANALLLESFARQDQGSFTKEYQNEIIPKLMSFLKSDYVEEVKRIMTNYKHHE